MIVRQLKAQTIPTSAGIETIQVTVNKKYHGSAPVGLSNGKKSVLPFPSAGISLNMINTILDKALSGFSFNKFEDLKIVEQLLFDFDKSEKLEKLGGNVVIALEYALLRAAAEDKPVWKFLNPYAHELPVPIGVCISGGKHHKEGCDFQEFLVIPHGQAFQDNIFVNQYVYNQIDKYLRPLQRSGSGAWVVPLDSVAILDALRKIQEEVFDKFSVPVGLGVDVAASHLYSGGYYFYAKGKLDREQQIKHINMLISRYELEYMEDPVEENDTDGFDKIKGDYICGDDLVCSNLDQLREVRGKINSVIVMPNSAGSLLKTKAIIDYAQQNFIVPILSYRAGETMDDMLAELAVGWNVPYIKLGVFGKESLRKIHRLQEISKEMG